MSNCSFLIVATRMLRNDGQLETRTSATTIYFFPHPSEPSG